MIDARPHPHLRRALFVLSGCLALFAGLTVFVWTVPSRVDEGAIAALAKLRTPNGVEAAWLATHLGDRWTNVVLTTSAAAALLGSGRTRAAAFVTMAVAGAAVLNIVAKWAVDRPRPSIVPPVYTAAGMSFPSGHSMTSFALFVALWLVARHERFPYERAWLVLALVVVPIVGFTRAYLGVHYPSDVLAGWALSGAWLAVVHTWYVRHAPWTEPAPGEPDESPKPPDLLP